jgi:hypothetical protein
VAAWTGCKTDATQPGGEFTVRPPEAALLVGQSTQLSAIGAPGAVTWSSSNTAIATVVPQTGFVTAVGRGEAQITAVSGSTFASARIVVTVPPALALAAPTAAFEITRGDADPAPIAIAVTNAGDGTLGGLAVGAIQYSDGQPQGWLSATLSGATAPATLTLRAAAGSLPAGTYDAVVPVTATGVANSPQNVNVTFRVVAPASIELSRSQVPMATTPVSSVEETVNVTNGGGRPLTGLATSIAYVTGTPGWLTATLSATSAPALLLLRANGAGLAQATYTAQVTVSSTVAGVAPRTIAVTLVVGPGPAIQLSRTTVPFSAQNQGPAPPPQTVNVTNGGGGTLTDLSLGAPSYAQGQPTGWISATLDRTVAPAVITLTANPAGLNTGTYTATIAVRSTVASNTPINLTVTLTIGPPPAIGVNPTAVGFATYQGGNVPGAQGITVTNSGGGTLTGLSYSIAYSGSASGWLGTPAWQGGSTTAPTILILQPTTTALPRGTHVATVTIQSSLPGVASRAVVVTYSISSFSVDIAPLFSQAAVGYARMPCSNCHLELGGTTAQRYAYLQPHAASGLLMCKITAGATCPAEMTMPPALISLIQAWISAGSPSN